MKIPRQAVWTRSVCFWRDSQIRVYTLCSSPNHFQDWISEKKNSMLFLRGEVTSDIKKIMYPFPTHVRPWPYFLSFLFFRSFPFDDEKILLLDVGSCFNPFSAYDEFYAVGIDISPALEVRINRGGVGWKIWTLMSYWSGVLSLQYM